MTEQLEGNDMGEVELQPVNLNLSILKELGAKWLVEMVDYVRDNPQFIVKGFIKAGILGALDGNVNDLSSDEEDEDEYDDDADFEADTDESDTDLERAVIEILDSEYDDD